MPSWLVPADGHPEASHDLLLATGGPMSVHDTEDRLASETALIGEAIRAGTAVIGVRLGSRLMAKAPGAAGRPLQREGPHAPSLACPDSTASRRGGSTI